MDTAPMRSSTSAAALLLVFALLAGCGSSTPPALPPMIPVPVDGSPQRGPADAWVTVVEFGDFQCSYCRAEEPVLTGALAAYPTDARLVWKQLPITSIHPNAQAAAVAAECAFLQDRFWEMHDLLLTSALDAGALAQDALHVPGLDVAAWQACTTGTEATSRIASDVALALQLGVPGTPTFVVNGFPIVGAASDTTLRTQIERARAAAIGSGIARADYYDRAVLGR